MLKRYFNSTEIMAQEKIVHMLMEGLVSPSIGRVKSACEAVYNKQQGRFYTVEDESEVLAILGYRIIDKTCELLHVVMKKEGLSSEAFKGYLKEALLLDGLNEAHMIIKEDQKSFYKKSGFSIKPYKMNDIGYDRFMCTLKI